MTVPPFVPQPLQPQTTLNHPIVVFSKNYLPMARIPLRRAVTLLVTGRAEPLQSNPSQDCWQIKSPNLVVDVPQQIRLCQDTTKHIWKVPAPTRREILRRDRHTCQYCGDTRELTIDHVLPTSRGGQHIWTNVVTACQPCNGRKGARTPDEAKMLLRHPPKPPLHPVVAFADEFWKTNTPA